MKLKCPRCHSFVFSRFKLMEALLVIAELFVFYKIVSSSLATAYKIPAVIIGIMGVEYLGRFAYIMIHNEYNKNGY